MKKIFQIALLIFPLLLFSQEKQEYEERIKKEAFPKEAITLISPIFDQAGKVKYYHEFDGEEESFEAKFKLDGKKYSVEFNKQGTLEDIEVVVDKEEISESTITSIETYLETNFDRWKIEKIQLQFKGPNPSQVLEDAIEFKKTNENNLELIVATKTDGKLTKFEMRFNSNGKFLNKRKVVRRSYDFLLF